MTKTPEEILDIHDGKLERISESIIRIEACFMNYREVNATIHQEISGALRRVSQCQDKILDRINEYETKQLVDCQAHRKDILDYLHSHVGKVIGFTLGIPGAVITLIILFNSVRGVVK